MADLATIVSTYTSAADTFDALPFWHYYGRRTVAVAKVARGERVLDLCCGTGASAIPAAEATGPTGRVVGVDITPALVEQARARAASRGVAHAVFEVGDVTALPYPAASFEVVLSVFGLFFLDDMPGMVRRAYQWLTPGGRLVITAWGASVLAPGESYFLDAVEHEGRAVDRISKTDRLSRPEAIETVFADAGVPTPRVIRERWQMPLSSPDAFWPVILGTSNRGLLEALPRDAQARVKASVIGRLRNEAVTGLDNEALIAVVTKPDA